MTRRYAADTSVPADRTETEIKALLRNHGATGIMIAEHSSYGGAPDRLRVAFELNSRHIRFDATLPHPADKRYDRDGGNYRYGGRPEHLRRKAWDQDVRQRWRALLLRIRARLEELDDLAAQGSADHAAAGARADSAPHTSHTGPLDITEITQKVFLGQLVLPGGETLEDWATPQLEQAYRSGTVPPLLPGAHSQPQLRQPDGTIYLPPPSDTQRSNSP